MPYRCSRDKHSCIACYFELFSKLYLTRPFRSTYHTDWGNSIRNMLRCFSPTRYNCLTKRADKAGEAATMDLVRLYPAFWLSPDLRRHLLIDLFDCSTRDITAASAAVASKMIPFGSNLPLLSNPDDTYTISRLIRFEKQALNRGCHIQYQQQQGNNERIRRPGPRPARGP